MSRTNKDKLKKQRNKTGVSKFLKAETKEKRKTLKNETNPRVLRLKSANKWSYL